jgi:hypothetical protein
MRSCDEPAKDDEASFRINEMLIVGTNPIEGSNTCTSVRQSRGRGERRRGSTRCHEDAYESKQSNTKCPVYNVLLLRYSITIFRARLRK